MDVVDAYGAVIERLASTGRQVHSSTEPPFGKPLIEVALLTLATHETTSVPETMLKAGYMELSTFRDGESGVSVALAGTPTSTREEMATFMKETAPQLATQTKEMEAVVEESAKRSVEWDKRLAAMRSADNA